MYVEVPKVSKCCFCVPLRGGLILFSFFNVIIALSSLTCLVITTEIKVPYIFDISGWDLWSFVTLFNLLGLEVIINAVLLVGGCQKDVKILRLYNKYAILMVLAGLIPSAIMVYRLQFVELGAGLLALCVQAYGIIIVRSEIIKLENVETTRRNRYATPVTEEFEDESVIVQLIN